MYYIYIIVYYYSYYMYFSAFSDEIPSEAHEQQSARDENRQNKPTAPINFKYEVLPWLNSSGVQKKAEA